MNDQKQQIIEKLQAANNILVTVSRDPSVDQLSACIGMTLLLGKMKKHATAVFSGAVPPIIGFLKPEETIEPNTDSLRDFIIALDKAKADKLRYKVEDEVVKIFITPYKSSISEKDLIYSQGDFNVDVVLALGVHKQQDLDDAITAHGRILHDAVVISVNTTPNGELGSINWQAETASGMSELATMLAQGLGEDLLDAPIATALLTGIVAETDHFGNQKTTPQVMTVGAALLAAGADQQLVARELGHGAGGAAVTMPTPQTDSAKKSKVESDDNKPKAAEADDPLKALGLSELDATSAKTDDKKHPEPDSLDALLQEADADLQAASVISMPDAKSSVSDDVNKNISDDAASNVPLLELPQPESQSPKTGNTLADLEESVLSPHLENAVESTQDKSESTTDDHDDDDSADGINSARKAVEDAIKANASDDNSAPLSVDSVAVDLDLGHEDIVQDDGSAVIEPATPDFTPSAIASPLPHNPAANEPAPLNMSPADQPFTMPLPPSNTNAGLQVPPPLTVPPTSAGMPPQGPPPPPLPPPLPPGA